MALHRAESAEARAAAPGRGWRVCRGHAAIAIDIGPGRSVGHQCSITTVTTPSRGLPVLVSDSDS